MRNLILAVPFALAAATPAFADSQKGLVNVNIEDVANDIANDLAVNVSEVPVTVQVPVGVAANVCGVDANVLAKQKNSGGASCTASSSSQALTQVVQKQMAKL